MNSPVEIKEDIINTTTNNTKRRVDVCCSTTASSSDDLIGGDRPNHIVQASSSSSSSSLSSSSGDTTNMKQKKKIISLLNEGIKEDTTDPTKQDVNSHQQLAGKRGVLLLTSTQIQTIRSSVNAAKFLQSSNHSESFTTTSNNNNTPWTSIKKYAKKNHNPNNTHSVVTTSSPSSANSNASRIQSRRDHNHHYHLADKQSSTTLKPDLHHLHGHFNTPKRRSQPPFLSSSGRTIYHPKRPYILSGPDSTNNNVKQHNKQNDEPIINSFAGPLWKSSPAPSRVPPPIFMTGCCHIKDTSKKGRAAAAQLQMA